MGIRGSLWVAVCFLMRVNAPSFLLSSAWPPQVTNVDDEGNELGSGIMELTQTELILHTHKRDAVRWPYLCLRRYGYDSNLFSFESGRRCQTGQGECSSPGGRSSKVSAPWQPGLSRCSQIPPSNKSTGPSAVSVPPEHHWACTCSRCSQLKHLRRALDLVINLMVSFCWCACTRGN